MNRDSFAWGFYSGTGVMGFAAGVIAGSVAVVLTALLLLGWCALNIRAHQQQA